MSDKQLKDLVSQAVAEALDRERSKIAAAVLEALEDAALLRAMEEADDELADPAEVEKLLAGDRRES